MSGITTVSVGTKLGAECDTTLHYYPEDGKEIGIGCVRSDGQSFWELRDSPLGKSGKCFKQNPEIRNNCNPIYC